MKKILFRLTLGAVLLALCVSAEAQQATKNSRIGILGDAPPSGLIALRKELRGLGWVEGQNLTIDYRPNDGKREILSDIATKLIQLKADVIVAPGTGSAVAAKQATKTIPIVMLSSDPVGNGLVASLAQPGGNITGVSNVQVELGGKRLEILKEAFPQRFPRGCPFAFRRARNGATIEGDRSRRAFITCPTSTHRSRRVQRFRQGILNYEKRERGRSYHAECTIF